VNDISRPVFISYARGASAAGARALANRLGDLAFLDTSDIDDGDHFPECLLEGILNARVIVIFAPHAYSERRFCRLEMRLALAGGDPTASHLVLALGEGSGEILDGMPVAVASTSWPTDSEIDRLEALSLRLLDAHPLAIRERLPGDEAQKLAISFLNQSGIPEPRSMRGISNSLLVGTAAQSIGSRFVGRAEDLRLIHRTLSETSRDSVQAAIRIVGGVGRGKSRLAVEYIHRYGAQYFKGGIYWLNGAASDIEWEFWRILKTINPDLPDLATCRTAGRDVRGELKDALCLISEPALFVIDNIPESSPGEDPPSLSDLCPAFGSVAIIATSRQDTREEGVRTVSVDSLNGDSSILLITDGVPGSGRLAWSDWRRITEWVGHLPLALDLLNRSLALNSISPSELLERIDLKENSQSATKQLDGLREALRGQVPKNSVRGITEAFSISFEKLDETSQRVVLILAQLGSAPILEEFLDALPEEWNIPSVRAALASRHFVTSPATDVFGSMHRLTADFLLGLAMAADVDTISYACDVVRTVMKPDRCKDPREWALMNICREHAEAVTTRVAPSDTAAVLSSDVTLCLARLASAQGNYVLARLLCHRALEAMKTILGDEHSATMGATNELVLAMRALGDPEARRLQESLVKVASRVLGEKDQATLTMKNNLASILRESGELVAAQRLQEELVEARTEALGAEHQETLNAINNLAVTLAARGELKEARRLQETLMDTYKRTLGEHDLATLRVAGNLANTLQVLGIYETAENLATRVLNDLTRLVGPEHLDTIKAMETLAHIQWVRGRRRQARRHFERILELRDQILGPQHEDTLAATGDLALALRTEEDYSGARVLQERVLNSAKRLLGSEHPRTVNAANNLSITLVKLGERKMARKLQEWALEVSMRKLGAKHPNTLTTMANLSGVRFQDGDVKGARLLLRACLDGRREVLGTDHPDVLATAEWLRKIS